MEAEKDHVKNISVNKGKFRINVLLDVVFVPNEVGVVLDRFQIGGLPPIGEGHLFELGTVVPDQVVHVGVEVLRCVPSVFFGYLRS